MDIEHKPSTLWTFSWYRLRHKSVNTPLSHERLVVHTWLAVYSGWVKLHEMRDTGATAAILDPTLEF